MLLSTDICGLEMAQQPALCRRSLDKVLQGLLLVPRGSHKRWPHSWGAAWDDAGQGCLGGW